MTKIDEVLSKTEDAYSRSRYGNVQWVVAAHLLLERGLTVDEASVVLNSKWPRWAGDDAAVDDAPTAAELVAYLDNPKNRFVLSNLMHSHETGSHYL